MQKSEPLNISQQDSYDSYTTALLIVIALTLAIACLLHWKGCVPPDYFPKSPSGIAALVFIAAACVVCWCSRGVNLKLMLTRDRLYRVRIAPLSDWITEILILFPSVAALYLLLYSSGGTASPFVSYVSTFPIVISLVSRRVLFVWVTATLTLGLYVADLFAWFGIRTIGPTLGHEIHYKMATLIPFTVSLAFTAMLALDEIRRGNVSATG